MNTTLPSPEIRESNLSFRDALAKRAATTRIVLHHAAASGCSVEDIHRWHLDRGWSGIGYHYYVRKDGSTTQHRRLDEVGAHCRPFNKLGKIPYVLIDHRDSL